MSALSFLSSFGTPTPRRRRATAAAPATRPPTDADARAVQAALQADNTIASALIAAHRPYVPTRWGVRPDGRGAGPSAEGGYMRVLVPLTRPGFHAPAGLEVLPAEQWLVAHVRGILQRAGCVVDTGELDTYGAYQWSFVVRAMASGGFAGFGVPLPGDLVGGERAEAFARAHGWTLAGRFETGPDVGDPYKFTKPNRLDVVYGQRRLWYIQFGPNVLFSTATEAMAAADARGSAVEVPWDHPRPVPAGPAPWPATGGRFEDRHRSSFLVDWVPVGKLAVGDRILEATGRVERVLEVSSKKFQSGWLKTTSKATGTFWPLEQQFLRLRRM